MSGKAAIQSAASDTSTSSTAASQFRPGHSVGPSAAAASLGGGTGQPRGTSQERSALAGRGAEQLRGGFQGGAGEVLPGQSWEEYAAGLKKSALAGADEEAAASAGRTGADLAAAPLQAGGSAEQGWAAGLPATGGGAAARRSLPSVLGKQDRAVPLVMQGSAAEHSQASPVAVGSSEERPSKRQHMGESAAEAEQGQWPGQASGGAAAQQGASAEGSPAAVRGAGHPAQASEAAAAQQESSAEGSSGPARGCSPVASSGSQTPLRSSLIKRAVAEVNWQSASPTGSPRAFLPRGSPRAGAVSTGQGQRGPAWQPQAEKIAPALALGAAGRPSATVDLGQVQAGQAGEPQAEGQAKPQGSPAAARNSQAAEPSASTVSGQEEPAVEQQSPVGTAPSDAASARGKHAAATAGEEPAAAAGLGGAGAGSTDGPASPSTSFGREDAEQGTRTQKSSATVPGAPAPAAVDSSSLLQPAAANAGGFPISEQQQVSEGKADAVGAISGQAASLPSEEGGTPATGGGVDSEQGRLATHDLPRSSHSHPQQEVTSGAGSAPAGQALAAVSPGATTAVTTAGTPYTGSGSTLRLGRLLMSDQPSSPSAGAVQESKASFKPQDGTETGVGPGAVPAAAAEELGQGRETHSQVRVGLMLLPAQGGPTRHVHLLLESLKWAGRLAANGIWWLLLPGSRQRSGPHVAQPKTS